MNQQISKSSNLQIEYIIVGQGFAGSFIACELLLNNKSFIIIDNSTNKASEIAAGIYNPIILKRFTPIWEADEQISFFIDKIKELEQFFNVKFLHEDSVLRILDNGQEKKTWIRKARNKLIDYLDGEIIDEKENIIAPFGLGKVKQSGRINASVFLNTVKEYCKNYFLEEEFDYKLLNISETEVEYKNYTAQNIVFCEGMNVKNNPYFNFIPLKSNKGECLQVELEKPIDNFIYKKKYFLFKEGDNTYYVGGTNNSEDESYQTTEQVKAELMNSVQEIYSSTLKIISHKASIRPTTIDRRPVTGQHSVYKNLYIINGLGTRGTLLGAKCAHELFQFIENKTPINEEIDVKRFYQANSTPTGQ